MPVRHLEVVLPPVDDVEKAVREILAPFVAVVDEAGGVPHAYAFCDRFEVVRWRTVEELRPGERADRVLIASQKADLSGLEAVCMFQRETWNGINMVESLWGGSLYAVIDDYRLMALRPSRGHVPIGPNWIVVRVSYE